MPELPEVETIRLGLGRLLPGLTITAIQSHNPKSFPNEKREVDSFVYGASVLDVRRRAKVLMIDLSSHYSLVVHLKMTGQLVFQGRNVRFGAGHPGRSLVGQLPDTSTRVTILFSNGSKLFFNDQRKFGWMRLLPTAEVPLMEFMQKVGPEPLEAAFTWQTLRSRLQRRQKTSIKAALLDQTVIAGIGNIYADESLWGAKIHPATPVGSLSDSQFKNLYASLIAVLRQSIEKGGSTDKNYVDARGRKGSYLSFAHVFRRQGSTCERCGTVIIKTRVAGRGTHLCPTCQVLEIFTQSSQ